MSQYKFMLMSIQYPLVGGQDRILTGVFYIIKNKEFILKQKWKSTWEPVRGKEKKIKKTSLILQRKWETNKVRNETRDLHFMETPI